MHVDCVDGNAFVDIFIFFAARTRPRETCLQFFCFDEYSINLSLC